MQTPFDAPVGAVTLRPLEISHHRVGAHGCLVALAGEIDLASGPALKAALMELLAAGYRSFVLDLSDVTHMDSTGLGVLVGFQRRLDPDEKVVVAAMPPNVAGVFRVTGLDQHFDTFATAEEALADRPQPPDQPARSLGGDAALALGLAVTALPFAESLAGEAERWLRILSRHGDAARILRASGLCTDPLTALSADPQQSRSVRIGHKDRLAGVVDHAKRRVTERDSDEVTTTGLLAGVMAVYGDAFDRVLAAYGGSRETVDALLSCTGSNGTGG